MQQSEALALRPGLADACSVRKRLTLGYDRVDPVVFLEIARRGVPDLRRHAEIWLAERDDGQP